MPKIIELTVEIDIQRVSCPGVWLCQDGRVSLTVFALGTNYQTCLLPPMFPLMFKDVFYFRKRFQETCALNNICCLLKNETIFCELVQWCEDCVTGECTILAQYLGALNDVLFPPNMCSNDGVDLLMRRSKEFPGILSPKIEIATKVRIDEVWNHGLNLSMKTASCHCSEKEMDASRQRQVCHSPLYHRNKCNSATKRPPSATRCSSKRPPSACRSRSRSGGSRSCCSMTKESETRFTCKCPNPIPCARARRAPARRPRSARPCRQYHACAADTAGAAWINGTAGLELDEHTPPSLRPPHSAGHRPRSATRSRNRQYKVYNVDTGDAWVNDLGYFPYAQEVDDAMRSSDTDKMNSPTEERLQKILLESRYIEQEINERMKHTDKYKKNLKPKLAPCICEICKRYHQLFHAERTKS